MYVDAVLDHELDQIRIVERINGKRIFHTMPAKYVLYYDDKKGKYRTIFGDKVSKFQTSNHKQFQKEVALTSNKKTFEADINPVFRCLADNYLGAAMPDLHIAFFDIEVDFHPEKGFSSPSDPHSPITAISVHLNWIGECFTLVVAPDTLTEEEAQAICAKFPNTVLCEDERELLEMFIGLIDDVDVISGWNSTGYDIPYIVRRIEMVMGKDYTRQLCLWDKLPRKRTYQKFKKDHITYDLYGRVHLDYLELYQKNTFTEQHSYRLDFIAEIEVGEKKIPYEGTLDALYKNDFERFIAYNIQDTMLLVKIDEKNKFIELANQLAHTNTVLLQTSMGSVALIEQAIINEAHGRGMIVPNRPRWEKDTPSKPVAGAYVADPKTGLHDWPGGVDIKSLYPSLIRALNMGPETLVGQLRQNETIEFIQTRALETGSVAEAWHEVFAVLEYDHVMGKDDKILTFDLEDGQSLDLSGKELYDFIFDQGSPYVISANGTIFRTDIEGVIPGLLTKWFNERVEMQNKKKAFQSLADKETDKDKKKEHQDQVVFWDHRQHARKILLNSLYGALLNEKCRFFDQRIGQSVTLSGRTVVKHMNAEVNNVITGDYNHRGAGIIYADTDSCYFSAYKAMSEDPAYRNFEWTKESVIELYDAIGNSINNTFPPFMKKSFNVPENRGKIIEAERELCAVRGLFITKKRYAVLIYDLNGDRQDINGKAGKIKAMGVDLKRADTPKIVQDFLEELLTKVLTDHTREEIITYIKEFRSIFNDRKSWEKGTPKRANAISDYTLAYDNGGHDPQGNRVSIPGHVRASINWNKLRQAHSDNYSMPIQDGQKVVVCRLKPNPINMKSVAYPIDEMHLPEWFKKLPFNDVDMETAIIDKKIDNLIGILQWDLSKSKEDTTFNDLFEI